MWPSSCFATILSESSPTNPEEYAPEAGLIVARLSHPLSLEQAIDIVYGVFVEQFGENVAGPKDEYKQLTLELIAACRR